jgi:hypothetical protein
MKDKINIKRYVKPILGGGKIELKAAQKKKCRERVNYLMDGSLKKSVFSNTIHYRFFGMEKEQYYGDG